MVDAKAHYKWFMVNSGKFWLFYAFDYDNDSGEDDDDDDDAIYWHN